MNLTARNKQKYFRRQYPGVINNKELNPEENYTDWKIVENNRSMEMMLKCSYNPEKQKVFLSAIFSAFISSLH